MRERIFALQSGTTVYGIKASVLKEIKIPVPPLAIQQEIVAEIEAEQALVSANRDLISRFEKKIQATLARVWGEEEPTPVEVLRQRGNKGNQGRFCFSRS
jgi:type I restriction enzyme M protein